MHTNRAHTIQSAPNIGRPDRPYQHTAVNVKKRKMTGTEFLVRIMNGKSVDVRSIEIVDKQPEHATNCPNRNILNLPSLTHACSESCPRPAATPTKIQSSSFPSTSSSSVSSSSSSSQSHSSSFKLLSPYSNMLSDSSSLPLTSSSSSRKRRRRDPHPAEMYGEHVGDHDDDADDDDDTEDQAMQAQEQSQYHPVSEHSADRTHHDTVDTGETDGLREEHGIPDREDVQDDYGDGQEMPQPESDVVEMTVQRLLQRDGVREPTALTTPNTDSSSRIAGNNKIRLSRTVVGDYFVSRKHARNALLGTTINAIRTELSKQYYWNANDAKNYWGWAARKIQLRIQRTGRFRLYRGILTCALCRRTKQCACEVTY